MSPTWESNNCPVTSDQDVELFPQRLSRAVKYSVLNTVLTIDGKHSTDEGKHSTDDGKHSTDEGKHSTDEGKHSTDKDE